MPPLVEVLLPRPIAHPFHYLIPESLRAQARPGVRAVVPFGRELLTGLIVQTGADPPARARGTLRSVEQLLDASPLLPAELIELLRRSADYYAVPWGDVLRAALPPLLLPSGDCRFRLLPSAPKTPLRSALARRLVEWLAERPNGLSRVTLVQRAQTADPSTSPAKVMATLRRLAAAGRIDISWHINPQKSKESAISTNNITTNSDKNDLNEHHLSHFDKKEFSVFLYQNPDTAECWSRYIAATASMIEQGRSVLLLAPEIARAEALAVRMEHQLQHPVVRLHSAVTPPDRARYWIALHAAPAPQIVVGSRSALFAPVPSLGLIVVDEEADPLYKQEERPRLQARDVAILRAQQARIPILLGGRLISVESYEHGRTGKYRWLDEPSAGSLERVRFARGVVTRVIDLRNEPLSEGLLTKPLIDALGERLARREQALLFVNRRGYASGLICRDCGTLSRCPACRTILRYRKREADLQCRYCGFRAGAPTVCAGCQGQRLSPLGTGTQRVEEALQQHWPQARLARIDRDAPEPAEENADLLIGTQRCLHHPPPPRLTLIAVLDAELDLSRPDFRAEERALQLLVGLQGLLRPEASAATLIIQSRHPGRPALQALAADAPSRFYDEELAQRKELGYPPFSRLAVLRLSGGAAALRRDQADRLVRQARPRLETLPEPRAELWGPVSAPLKGRDGWELLLKAPTPATLHRALAAIRRLPLAVQLEAQNALQIEVDPA